MIQIEQLVKKYSAAFTLNIPSLCVGDGESIGLVGNNGAGKTTLFRLMLDLIRPTAGAVLSKRNNVQGNDEWKRYTGAFLDERMLIDFLTPEEYFDFIGRLNEFTSARFKEFYAAFDEFFHGEILGQKKYIRDLSKGNQKKVGLAAALMSEPELLVLDEPFPHLDPSTVIRLKKMLQEQHARRKTTMLISSHDLYHVTDVCGRIILLEAGNIVHDLQTNESTLATLQQYFGTEIA